MAPKPSRTAAQKAATRALQAKNAARRALAAQGQAQGGNK
jgi:hypothetical protein